MQLIDIIIFGIYIVGILIIGSVVGKSNSSGEEYFSGGRSMPWYAIGLSVGLTMISANTFIGGPGWGYFDGIVGAMVNITVPLAIFFITYTILPIVYHHRVVTVYEYVERSCLAHSVPYLRVGLRVYPLSGAGGHHRSEHEDLGAFDRALGGHLHRGRRYQGCYLD